MTTETTSEKALTVSSGLFTDAGDERVAVNLRVGMIDVDLTPEAAEDLGRRLIEGARFTRRMALPQ